MKIDGVTNLLEILAPTDAPTAATPCQEGDASLWLEPRTRAQFLAAQAGCLMRD